MSLDASKFTKEERIVRAVQTLRGKDGRELHEEMAFLARLGVPEEEMWEALDRLAAERTKG